jgi:hypothetical protein
MTSTVASLFIQSVMWVRPPGPLTYRSRVVVTLLVVVDWPIATGRLRASVDLSLWVAYWIARSSRPMSAPIG